MKNNFILKFISFYSVLTLNACFSFSQAIDTSGIDTKTTRNATRKSGLSFSISPYIVNKAKATPLSGAYHLKTIYMYGFEAGPNYHIHINNNYSLIIGLHGGAAATNYKLFISKSDFNPNLNFDVHEDGQLTSAWDFYMSVPIWIEKRWFTKNNSFWNFIVGANVRYYPIRYYGDESGINYPDVNGNYILVLDINDSIGNNLRPWVNYNIGGGYSMLLRNNNYLQLNLVANFSGKKIIDGTYQINVSGKPQSTGAYSENWSYIGLSFSYIFTGANKQLRKMYEQKLEKE